MSDLATVRMLEDLRRRLERLEALESGAVAVAWTPTFVGGSVAGSFTYARQAGRLAVMGPFVFFWGAVQISAISVAPVGSMFINGLPLVTSNITNLAYPVTFGYVSNVSMSNAASKLRGEIAPNDASIALYEERENTAGVAVTGTDFDDNAAAYVDFSGFYLIG